MRPRSKRNAVVSVPRTKFRLGYLSLLLAITIAGLILLVISLQPQQGQTQSNFFSLILNQLSTALLVGGLLSGTFELFLRQEFVDISDENTQKILDEITLARKETSLGLKEAIIDARSYDYSSLILGSDKLTIVLNDGKTWTSNNEPLLERRFEDPSKETTFILVHPDSPELKALANKVGSSEEALKAKIGETIRFLNRLKLSNTNLNIYGHSFPNPYSLFLGDDEAIITLYFHGGESRAFPLFRFQDRIDGHCFFKGLQKSTEKLKSQAGDISKHMIKPSP